MRRVQSKGCERLGKREAEGRSQMTVRVVSESGRAKSMMLREGLRRRLLEDRAIHVTEACDQRGKPLGSARYKRRKLECAASLAH
jgi:hypothetical protein